MENTCIIFESFLAKISSFLCKQYNEIDIHLNANLTSVCGSFLFQLHYNKNKWRLWAYKCVILDKKHKIGLICTLLIVFCETIYLLSSCRPTRKLTVPNDYPDYCSRRVDPSCGLPMRTRVTRAVRVVTRVDSPKMLQKAAFINAYAFSSDERIIPTI